MLKKPQNKYTWICPFLFSRCFAFSVYGFGTTADKELIYTDTITKQLL